MLREYSPAPRVQQNKRKMKLAILVTLLGISAAVPLHKAAFASEVDALFSVFKNQHGKAYYDQMEESYRKVVFAANLEIISKHNEEHTAGKHKFTLAMNKFGDLTQEEFAAKVGNFKPRHEQLRSHKTTNLPQAKDVTHIDWSKLGAVTPVVDQGACGSSWAFAAIGSVEGAWAIKTKLLNALSVQQMMDCSKSEGNQSCSGGLMTAGFEFIIKNNGSCTEASYPYMAKDREVCGSCSPIAIISSYTEVGQNDVELAKAVTLGPVATAINAAEFAYQFYSSGILTEACSSDANHGTLVVGFGTWDDTPYWKVCCPI
jgi:C1A family cysteine protease